MTETVTITIEGGEQSEPTVVRVPRYQGGENLKGKQLFTVDVSRCTPAAIAYILERGISRSVRDGRSTMEQYETAVQSYYGIGAIKTRVSGGNPVVRVLKELALEVLKESGVKSAKASELGSNVEAVADALIGYGIDGDTIDTMIVDAEEMVADREARKAKRQSL